MGLLVLGEAEIKPDALEEMKAYLREILPDTRAFEGNEGIGVYTDRENPTSMLYVEHWRTREDFDRYVAWRTETGAIEKQLGMMARPFTLRMFENIED